MTFDEAVSKVLLGAAIRRPGPVEWSVIGWDLRRDIYPRVRLPSGMLVGAPITLTTEDITATDWELVPSAP